MSRLQGKRIVITRPPEKAQAFADQLREMGAIPIILPMIAIEPLADTRELDAQLQNLAAYDWVIFTSANTVKQVWSRFDALHIQSKFNHVAAIGMATANALNQHGIEPDLMPDEHVAEALFDLMQQQLDVATLKFLLPQGNLARPVLNDLLTQAGAIVEQITAYQTIQPEVDEDILNTPFDVITFTSSSTVTHFLERFEKESLGNAQVACIGPITAQTAEDAGLPVHIVAEPHTLEGLLISLEAAFERNIVT